METPIVVAYISCSILVLYLLVSTRLERVKKRDEEGKIMHYTLAMLAATAVQLVSFVMWLSQTFGG